jgi:hypothetical protein
MAEKGYVDTDLGLEDIRKNIAEMGNLRVKVGIVEGAGDVEGVPVAQYAAWNEFGVEGPPYSQHGKGVWFIPPRPFIRGWLTEKEANIKGTIDRLYKQVSDGKLDAKTAMGRLGQFGQDGIKAFIRNGHFEANADRTIKIKKSSRPLIDTGTMRNSVRYQVINKDDAVEGPVEG